MNLILLGAPGSGKGTQAEQLVEKNNFIQFSTGDVMRKEINAKTSLGIECQKFIDEGHLVPDEIVNEMVLNYLKEKHDGLIFDGYPRTIDQAKALDAMLSSLNAKIDKVFYINVRNEILLERITNRLVCPVCKRSYNLKNRKPKIANICDYDGATLTRRSDDAPEKVKVRLEEYEKNTRPLITFYQENKKLVEVEGHNSDPKLVYNEILKELNK